MNYKLIYALESLSNFPNHECEEDFVTVEEAFNWAKNNLDPEYVYVVEEKE